MSPPLVIAGVVAVLSGLFVAVFVMRRKRPSLKFADDREEQLTHRLAEQLRCTPADALPAMRRELELSPNQSDATLLKRAAYHYRSEIPERQCMTYRDASPG